MQFLKKHLAPVMAGLVILAGASYALAADESSPPTDEVTLAQVSTDDPESDAQDGRGGPSGHRPHGHPGFPHAIRGELVVPEREGDGYTTVRLDRGILDRVDGTTLVVNEDDGTTVEIPTTEETRVYRDGEEATLAELEAGDHVATFRVKEGDAFVTKGVRAISPEQWEEMDERRAERREGMRERFRERRDEQPDAGDA